MNPSSKSPQVPAPEIISSQNNKLEKQDSGSSSTNKDEGNSENEVHTPTLAEPANDQQTPAKTEAYFSVEAPPPPPPPPKPDSKASKLTDAQAHSITIVKSNQFENLIINNSNSGVMGSKMNFINIANAGIIKQWALTEIF